MMFDNGRPVAAKSFHSSGQAGELSLVLGSHHVGRGLRLGHDRRCLGLHGLKVRLRHGQLLFRQGLGHALLLLGLGHLLDDRLVGFDHRPFLVGEEHLDLELGLGDLLKLLLLILRSSCLATSRWRTGVAMASGGVMDVTATARISIPCLRQFSFSDLSRFCWKASRSMPLMNWPPVSLDPPIRQIERLSGVDDLGLDLGMDLVAVVVFVIVAQRRLRLSSGITRNSIAPSIVTGNPSADRKSIAMSLLKIEPLRAGSRPYSTRVAYGFWNSGSVPGGIVFFWTPRRPRTSVLRSGLWAVARPGWSPRPEARGNGDLVVDLDDLGVPVVRVPPRRQDAALDALLARLGQDLSGRHRRARERDAHADLALGDLDLDADPQAQKSGLETYRSSGENCMLHALVLPAALILGPERSPCSPRDPAPSCESTPLVCPS